jgi:hypothetical protein
MTSIDIHKRRLLHGTLLKWDEQKGYHDRDGVKPALGPYYVVGLARGYQHWKNQTLLEEIIEEPSKPLPDLKALNAAIPRSEWEISRHSGQPNEPWQFVHALYLFSPSSGEFFTLLNSTTGVRMLWENFQERWEVMKALRGAEVLACVQLSERPFKTRNWGMKQRPDFNPIEWHKGEGNVNAVLFKPTQPQLPPATSNAPTEPTQAATPQNAQPASQPASQPAPRPPQGQVTFLPPIKPVTRSEELKDEIPF